MATIKNRDLERGGINTDVHPVELPLNTFTDGLNVRFRSGSAITRDADLAIMGKPPAVPINLREVNDIWYWGSIDRLWEFDNDTGRHVDVTHREYPPEVAQLGDLVTPIWTNGVFYGDGLNIEVSLENTEWTFGIEIIIGDVLTSSKDRLTTFTVTALNPGANRAYVTTTALDEASFRSQFEFPNTVYKLEGDPGEEVEVIYALGEVNEGYTDGIDWAQKRATFLGDVVDGTYVGLVGTTVLLGQIFTGIVTENTTIDITVIDIIDTNSFVFTTIDSEAEVVANFSHPVFFNGLSGVSGDLIPETYTGTFYWEFTPFGATTVASNENNTPQIRTAAFAGDDRTGFFYDLPGWGVENLANDAGADPLNWRCKVVRAYDQFLIAINMTQEEASPDGIHAGGSYPQRVRWSSTAIPGQAPTSWNGATLETNAGWNDLSGVTGTLIDGAVYRDSFLLFTESEVIEMRFVGGSSIFTFKKIFDDGGLLARNCAIEFKGKQFCIGPNDVYVHDTSTKTSVATDKVKARLFDEIGRTNTENIRLMHNEINEEIWILYSEIDIEDGNVFPLTRVAVYSYRHENWTFFTLEGASGIDIGVRPPLDVEVYTAWDDASVENILWDQALTPWSGRSSGFGNLSIIYSSYGDLEDPDNTGAFYLCDHLQETEVGSHVERYLEKIGIDVSQVAQGEIDRWCYVDRMFPVISAFEGSSVRVLVTGSEFQHQLPVFYNELGVLDPGVEEYIFVPGNDYKVDIRQTWSFLALRIEFTFPTAYEVHVWDYEVKSRGRR
jgi:hypothetical protein